MREAINSWLTGLVSGAVGPAAQTAGALMDPARLTAAGGLYQLWADSRAVANTLFGLLVLAGAVMVLGFESVQSRYAIKQIAPRLVMGWLTANLSWPVITTATQLGAALAVAVAGSALHPADILSQLVTAATSDGPTFMVILAGVVAVLALVLTLTLIVIIALLLGLTVLAPLALCLHALPHTEAIAWWWWRAFAGALTIPTLHALLLALLARVLLTPGGLATEIFGIPVGPVAPRPLLTVLVVIALLYLMIKIPGTVLRAATGRGGRRGGVLRAVLSSVVLSAGLGALGIPLPAAGLVGRGATAVGARSGLAALGLRAASARRSPQRPTTARTPTRQGGTPTSPADRPTSTGSAATASGAAQPQPDPYARIHVSRGGQLLLPLPGLTRRRPIPTTPASIAPPQPPSSSVARPPTPPAAASGGDSAVSGRNRRAGQQLSLPLGGEWPEHRPVLGRGGQYRLPIRAPHTRTPTTRQRRTPGTGSPLPRDMHRPGPGQMALPLVWPRPPRRATKPAPGSATPTSTRRKERGLS